MNWNLPFQYDKSTLDIIHSPQKKSTGTMFTFSVPMSCFRVLFVCVRSVPTWVYGKYRRYTHKVGKKKKNRHIGRTEKLPWASILIIPCLQTFYDAISTTPMQDPSKLLSTLSFCPPSKISLPTRHLPLHCFRGTQETPKKLKNIDHKSLKKQWLTFSLSILHMRSQLGMILSQLVNG